MRYSATLPIIVKVLSGVLFIDPNACIQLRVLPCGHTTAPRGEAPPTIHPLVSTSTRRRVCFFVFTCYES